MIDENLKRYATDVESYYIDQINKFGSATKAAPQIGKSRQALCDAIQRVKKRAAKQNYSPEHDMDKPVPDGFILSGVSTYYNKDGEKTAQWVKSKIDQDRQEELLREAIQAFSSQITPEKISTPPEHTQHCLLNLYTITDYHLGMLANRHETGADWDVSIAEELLMDWFKTAISLSPDAEVGVFAQLGDFIHFDSLESVTPRSRHVVDADSRFFKIVRVAIRVIRRIINLLAQKHDKVRIIMCEGNHDLASSLWLREWLNALYEDDPRISIDTNPDPYYCYEFGDTSLFFHHGHMRKQSNIDDVFVAKYRETFGRTKYSYGHMGHLHHNKVIESALMTVEQHRTLASPDSYATRGGWISGREAKVITYHRDLGEVARQVISPKMVGLCN